MDEDNSEPLRQLPLPHYAITTASTVLVNERFEATHK